jgi:hypothetical protein
LTTPNHVAELAASRDAKAAEVKSLDAAIDRLDRIAKSTCGALAELTALHEDHQVRVEAWSLSGAMDAIPALDRKRVAQLEQERDLHANDKASASAGLKTLVDKRSHAKLEHQRIDRAVTVAALLVVIAEDLPRLADECKLARQAQVDRTSEFESLRTSILAQGAVLGAPELPHAIERLNIVFEQPVANGSLDAINAKLSALIAGANEKEAA